MLDGQVAHLSDSANIAFLLIGSGAVEASNKLRHVGRPSSVFDAARHAAQVSEKQVVEE